MANHDYAHVYAEVETGTFQYYHNWEAMAYVTPDREGERVSLPVLCMVVDTHGKRLFDYYQDLTRTAQGERGHSGTPVKIEFIRHFADKTRASWWRVKPE